VELILVRTEDMKNIEITGEVRIICDKCRELLGVSFSGNYIEIIPCENCSTKIKAKSVIIGGFIKAAGKCVII
jgi:uncharacterized CHY-type Zn-finger protein